MPIYEYNCPRCGSDFELLIFDRNEEVSCPECGAKNPKKLLSVFAHKSDEGFTPSTGGGHSCSGCSSTDCSGCS